MNRSTDRPVTPLSASGASHNSETRTHSCVSIEELIEQLTNGTQLTLEFHDVLQDAGFLS